MSSTRVRGVAGWPHVVSIALFAIGSALAMSFLHATMEWSAVGIAAAVCTAAWVGAPLRTAAARPWRWIGRAFWLFVLACYALWIYLAVAFGILLVWTVPAWLWALIVAAAIATATTTLRRVRMMVPLALPLGVWIAGVLSGWLREEVLLRCDDYLALKPPVQLIVPSDPNLASCRPGEVRSSGRFPRTIWQPPDGKRVVFTTQGPAAPVGLQGSICEARLDGDPTPHCVGPPQNKSQGIVEWPERGRLLVMQWGIPTPSGSIGGAVFELPRDEKITILAAHWFDEMIGDGFYEPRNSTLYMFSDRMNGIHRALLPDFAPAPTILPDILPGELRYDQAAGEGVLCGHHIGVAIRGAPFAMRNLADGGASPLERLAVSWGCDWDRTARKVYSTVPNLGLLEKIDYDTGRVEQRWFIGPGMRSVAYDRARRQVYFTDFLRGYVLALDEASGRIVGRWFVGRFSRWVRLTPDGKALLATGNLGIVRIPLDDQPAAIPPVTAGGAAAGGM
jgi:hypothetical protein